MDRMFHYCREQTLSNPAMMEALTRAGKTVNGLCECIASNFVAALPDRLARAALRGEAEAAPEMDRLYRRVGALCSKLPG